MMVTNRLAELPDTHRFILSIDSHLSEATDLWISFAACLPVRREDKWILMLAGHHTRWK
jgi:hypothetical protein